mgnify:CR=1 FL=1
MYGLYKKGACGCWGRGCASSNIFQTWLRTTPPTRFIAVHGMYGLRLCHMGVNANINLYCWSHTALDCNVMTMFRAAMQALASGQ